MNTVEPAALGASLSEQDYVRQRIQPRLSEMDYLHLRDLYRLLQKFAPAFHGDVFDYGCGGAPYRGLFDRCRSYITADVTPGPAVDRLLNPDGLTQEISASYDLVFSTQVLEHVLDPRRYIRECHRILRPGGRLLLTTHGMIQEHGCPYDFQRWTARGLEELVLRNGFRLLESGKATTQARAVIQLLHQSVRHVRCDTNRLADFFLGVFRKLYYWAGLPLLNWLAGLFESQAIVPAAHPAALYTVVYVWAETVEGEPAAGGATSCASLS